MNVHGLFLFIVFLIPQLNSSHLFQISSLIFKIPQLSISLDL